MNDILRNVPIEEREKICESIRNINKNIYKTSAIEEDIKYVFCIWNTYVQPSNPKNINCRGHRMTVFNQYKHYVRGWKEWKEQGASL